MASIHYEKVDVSSRALKALKNDFDEAPKEKKIGRWYSFSCDEDESIIKWGTAERFLKPEDFLH